MATAVSSSWVADAPLSVLEARAADAAVHGLLLSGTPLVLRRMPQPDSSEPQQTACEVTLAWPHHAPLRCQQLKLEIGCSARHIELFVEGVRRNLLGEDEQSEVYLGTFRGAKLTPASAGTGVVAAPQQLFCVSEEFLQRDAKTNVLKEMHRLRVKFVSLTGDKHALQLQEFKCAFVPLQVPSAHAAPAPPPPAFVAHASSDNNAHSTPNGLAAQLAGLALGGGGGGGVALGSSLGGLEVQAAMKGFQQMLEREMETKILRAVDEKLAGLSQRLAASEQRLLQLHQQVDATGSRVQASLEQIKQQFAGLEAHVQRQLSARSVREQEAAADAANGSVDGE
ncbi:hypothetical protein PybrP1_002647 [[Pythium] brassicae (nom. inval.)]|nr:hypothetical protein PybrP1_002647 [[Pythium] brassicae (nom. inval.)]